MNSTWYPSRPEPMTERQVISNSHHASQIHWNRTSLESIIFQSFNHFQPLSWLHVIFSFISFKPSFKSFSWFPWLFVVIIGNVSIAHKTQSIARWEGLRARPALFSGTCPADGCFVLLEAVCRVAMTPTDSIAFLVYIWKHQHWSSEGFTNNITSLSSPSVSMMVTWWLSWWRQWWWRWWRWWWWWLTWSQSFLIKKRET